MRTSRFREPITLLILWLFAAQTITAQAPGWWVNQGVLSGRSADDFAAINEGQLKNLARGAFLEMEARFHQRGGAGSTITALVRRWENAPNSDNFAAVNLGQLKATAKPFYERLLALGSIPFLPAWLVPAESSDNHAVANIGQAKRAFAFSIPAQTTSSTQATAGTSSRSSSTVGQTGNISAAATRTHLDTIGAPPVSAASTLGLSSAVNAPFSLHMATRTKSLEYDVRTRFRTVPVSEFVTVPHYHWEVYTTSSDPLIDTNWDGIDDDGVDDDGDSYPEDHPESPDSYHWSRDDVPDDGFDSDGDGDPDDWDEPTGHRVWDYDEDVLKYIDVECQILGKLKPLATYAIALNGASVTDEWSAEAKDFNIPWDDMLVYLSAPFALDDRRSWQTGSKTDRVIEPLSLLTTYEISSYQSVPQTFEGCGTDGVNYPLVTIEEDSATQEGVELTVFGKGHSDTAHQARFLVIDTDTDVATGGETISCFGAFTFVLPAGRNLPTSVKHYGGVTSGMLRIATNLLGGIGDGDGYVLTIASPSPAGVHHRIERKIIPYELTIDPELDPLAVSDDKLILIPTDETLTFSASLTFDDPTIIEADLYWYPGGGACSTFQATLNDSSGWQASTNFTPATTAGAYGWMDAAIHRIVIQKPDPMGGIPLRYPLGCNFTEEGANVVTAPGKASQFSAPGNYQIPADGKSEIEIPITIKDAYGNLVAQGTQVTWHLEGDGAILSSDSETDASGTVRARVQAGKIPGKDQVLVVYADEARFSKSIINKPLQLRLDHGPVTHGIGTWSCTFTLNGLAASGSQVKWQTTRGSFGSKSGTVNNQGSGSATVQFDPASEDPYGLVVVTAAVGGSIAYASVEIESIPSPKFYIHPDESSLVYGQTSPLTIVAWGLPVGTRVKVIEDNLPFSTQRVGYGLPANGSPDFPWYNWWGLPANRCQYDWSMSVDYTSPPGWTTNASLGLYQFGTTGFNLFNGRPEFYSPVFKYYLSGFSTVQTTLRVSMADPKARLVSGDGVRRRLTFSVHERQGTFTHAALDANKLEIPSTKVTQSVPYPGEPVGDFPSQFAKAFWRPQNAIPPATPLPAHSTVGVVTAATTNWQVLAPNSPPQLTFLGRDDQFTVTTNSALSARFYATCVNTRNPTVKITASLITPVTGYSPYSLTLPIRTTPLPTGPFASQLFDLIQNVQFDNGIPDATEQAELHRYANAHGANALAAVKAAPPVAGGDLQHQAGHGRKLIGLVQSIDNVTQAIKDLDQKLDLVSVKGADGKEIIRLSLGRSIVEASGQGGSSLGPYIKDDKLVESLRAVSGAADRESFVKIAKGTDIYRNVRDISHSVTALPFAGSIHDLEVQLSADGVIELYDAMKRLSDAATLHPEAAATLAIDTLDDVLRDQLNTWASSGGAARGLAVVTIGFYVGVIETTAMGAASAGESADIARRRSLARLLGTGLSAACQNPEAETDIQEMIPFWSWIVISSEVIDLWLAQEYYDCGKKDAQLAFSVVRDVPIGIGVAKGLGMVTEYSVGVTRRTITRTKQILGKFGNRVKRMFSIPPEPNRIRVVLQKLVDHPRITAGMSRIQAEAWLYQQATELANALRDAPVDLVLPKKTTVCSVVIDPVKGVYGKGFSIYGDTRWLPERLDPRMQTILNEIRSLTGTEKGFQLWLIENCAEFHAFNEILLEGGEPANILVRTVNTKDGSVKPACKNCKFFMKRLGIPDANVIK